MFLRSHKTLQQTLSFGVAVWFVFLSMAMHGLHHHNWGDLQAGFLGSYAAVYDDTGEHSGPTTITRPLGVDRTSRTGTGLCPVCLFLQTCNQRAIRWRSVEPTPAPQRQTIRHTTLHVPTGVIVTASPRAPPMPLL